MSGGVPRWNTGRTAGARWDGGPESGRRVGSPQSKKASLGDKLSGVRARHLHTETRDFLELTQWAQPNRESGLRVCFFEQCTRVSLAQDSRNDHGQTRPGILLQMIFIRTPAVPILGPWSGPAHALLVFSDTKRKFSVRKDAMFSIMIYSSSPKQGARIRRRPNRQDCGRMSITLTQR